MVAGAGSAEAAAFPGQTTLIIRNLPRKFAGADLVSELTMYVPQSALDFVYVPWDRKGTNNVGYGFVNFVQAATAEEAGQGMQGQPWRTGERSRPVKVQVAHVQGLEANLQRFAAQGGSVEEENVPLVFSGGAPADLEAALRRLRSPSCGVSTTTTTCGDCSPRGSMYTSSAGDFEPCDDAAALPPPPGLEPCDAAAALPPPPGLEAMAPLRVGALRGYAESRREVAAMLRQLLARMPMA